MFAIGVQVLFNYIHTYVDSCLSIFGRAEPSSPRASLVAGSGLVCSCGSQASPVVGAQAPAHGLSCSWRVEVFPGPGIKLRPRCWQRVLIHCTTMEVRGFSDKD